MLQAAALFTSLRALEASGASVTLGTTHLRVSSCILRQFSASCLMLAPLHSFGPECMLCHGRFEISSHEAPLRLQAGASQRRLIDSLIHPLCNVKMAQGSSHCFISRLQTLIKPFTSHNNSSQFFLDLILRDMLLHSPTLLNVWLDHSGRSRLTVWHIVPTT